MPKKPQIPPMEQPPKKPVVLSVTKQQMAGIKARLAQQQAAQSELTTFVSGVVAGHGIEKYAVVEMDDEKLTLTVQT